MTETMFHAMMWPVVALFSIVAALLILRPAWMRLLDRTIKAGREGVVFSSTQEQDKKDVSLTTKPTLQAADVMNRPISASVIEQENRIKTQISSLHDDSERIKVLSRMSADILVELDFRQIAYMVFGSQLDLLVGLAGAHGLPYPSAAEKIFHQAQLAYPTIHGNRSVVEWLNYLTVKNLIVIQNDKMDLTQYGADFLKFLVDARLAYPRNS